MNNCNASYHARPHRKLRRRRNIMRTTHVHACTLAVLAAYASVATVSGGSCDAPIQLSVSAA